MSEPEIAVVAGGPGAIGRVIVRRLAARGLTVVAVGRDADTGATTGSTLMLDSGRRRGLP